MTYSLFGTVEIEKLLLETFEAWIHARAANKSGPRNQKMLREDSADVYREIWKGFVSYCVPRGLSLEDISEEDLEIYLEQRGTGVEGQQLRVMTRGDGLTARYAHRVLSLVHWITKFDAKNRDIPINLAAQHMLNRPEYKYAYAEDKDPLPEYLNALEARRLVAYVTQIRPANLTDGPLSWKEVRDRTAVAVMLGAGITPGEVRSLTIDGVISAGGRKIGLPWKLRVEGDGTHPQRETPISEWAGRQLAIWLEMRSNLGIPGPNVFPSTLKGTEWSITRCFTGCRGVLEKVGLGSRHAGLFMLRHTFALRQLSKGKSEEDVCKWLGLSAVEKMSRYRRIVHHHVEAA